MRITYHPAGDAGYARRWKGPILADLGGHLRQLSRPWRALLAALLAASLCFPLHSHHGDEHHERGPEACAWSEGQGPVVGAQHADHEDGLCPLGHGLVLGGLPPPAIVISALDARRTTGETSSGARGPLAFRARGPPAA